MENTVSSCSLLIQQKINELTIRFNNCKQPTNEDLLELLKLITMLNDCQGGGDYNVLKTETIEGKKEVIYPIDFFHAFSLNVMEGSMDYGGVDFPAGTSRSVEFSTLNQQPVTFTVNEKSKVFIEYLTSK